MSYTNSKQFCVIPWHGVFLGHHHKLAPCCMWANSTTSLHKSKDLLTKYINEMIPVREKMIAGTDIEGCRDCYRSEEEGIFSLRQAFNEYYTYHYDYDYEKHIQDFNFLELEVKITDVCNYACAMCNPRNSTKIHTEWSKSLDYDHIKQFLDKNPNYLEIIRKNHTGPNKEKTYEILRNMLTQNSIRRLKISGGEPLLDTELIKILKNLDKTKKSNIALNISTNGSQDIVNWTKKIGDFELINFTVSLEGVGKVQEYIRKHCVWDEVEKNILLLKELTLRDERYNIDTNYVLQGMSIPNLDKLVLWTYNNDIPFGYSGLMTDQTYYAKLLSKNILNNNIINNSISKLEKIQPKEDWKKLLKNKYNKELHKEFLTWIKWYERNSKIKLINILPELYEI